MMLHPSTALAVYELRRQDLLTFAAAQRLAATAVTQPRGTAGSQHRLQAVGAAARLMLTGCRLQPRPRVWRLAW